MIITKEILDKKVPKEMIPTRLDSALNLYTNVLVNGKSGLLVYNVNPNVWNTLYSFYELNHKFTIDEYEFSKDNMTYRDIIEEYIKEYNETYEIKLGYTKEKRKQVLSEEYIKTFNLNNVTIKDELEPIFELKYSKSKNVWTLYYFENYVASSVDNLADLYNQRVYEQKILPLDPNITSIDGIEVVSNITYLLSIDKNIEKLNANKLEIKG